MTDTFTLKSVSLVFKDTANGTAAMSLVCDPVPPDDLDLETIEQPCFVAAVAVAASLVSSGVGQPYNASDTPFKGLRSLK